MLNYLKSNHDYSVSLSALDLDSFEAWETDEVIEAAFDCAGTFGTAGTFGCATGTAGSAGTLGTFGSASL